MNPVKIIAIILIAAGSLGLAYGGFSYTRDTHDVKLGPLEFSLKEKKTVDIPAWVGVAAIVAGGLLLVMGTKRK
jgi:TRAP-type C4-dicarboxylate transport system permease small subunit